MKTAHQYPCPWEGVNLDMNIDELDGTPCLCQPNDLKPYQVTLVHVTTGQTLKWTGSSYKSRHEAVADAFRDLVGMEQHDCLETWKVLEAVERKS